VIACATSLAVPLRPTGVCQANWANAARRSASGSTSHDPASMTPGETALTPAWREFAGQLQPAHERGELFAEPALATLLDLVFGSLWYRLIFGTGPLDQGWADAVTGAKTAIAGQARGGTAGGAR
jgi:hypothetical protein